MCDERGECAGEQSAFDVEFTYIVECDRTLDDVIDKLAEVGVTVEPWQRGAVSRWLDMFSDGSPIPLEHRVSMLRGMLRSHT